MNRRVLFCMTLIASAASVQAHAALGEMPRQVVITGSESALEYSQKASAKSKLPCGKNAVWSGSLTAKANALGREQLQQMTKGRSVLPGKAAQGGEAL